MSDRIEKAAQVIDGILSADPQIAHEMFGDEPDKIARALAEAGLLAPDMREEWGSQYDDGSGPVWRETWDGKPIRTRADAEAVAAQHRIPH